MGGLSTISGAHSAELRRALEPWTLGPLRLRNRILKAATNEGMAPGGVPTQALVRHHRSMAAGGAGLTTVAYCAVSDDGRTFPNPVVLNRQTVRRLDVLRRGLAQPARLCELQLRRQA